MCVVEPVFVPVLAPVVEPALPCVVVEEPVPVPDVLPFVGDVPVDPVLQGTPLGVEAVQGEPYPLGVPYPGVVVEPEVEPVLELVPLVG